MNTRRLQTNLPENSSELSEILHLYKKLKKIAKYESTNNGNMQSQRKKEILNGIDILMDEYISLQANKRNNIINFTAIPNNNTKDDFNNFFE